MSSCICPYRDKNYCIRIKKECKPCSAGCILSGKVKQIIKEEIDFTTDLKEDGKTK